MKNIGLFFGSFNPIHSGHLAVAEFFAQNPNLEEVWLVVSPQSPFKEKNTLMENHHRLAMVQLAIEDKSNLKACAEEFDLPSPNYTINTLDHLKKKYPQYHIYNLDALTYAGNLENLVDIENEKNYTFLKGDINDHIFIESIFQNYNF